jgi:2-oxoglutarate ferredoxin oxidoreductase subunit beta
VIAQGIAHTGFSLIEAVTQCPISYGRQNKKGDAPKMMQWQRDYAVNVEAAKKMTAEQLQDKFLIGVLHKSEAPEYTKQYQELVIDKAQKGAK